GAHPGRCVRSHGEPLDAVSGARLPCLGLERAIPAGRRLRIPRPAAGCTVAAVFETGSLSFASGAGRVAAVRPGRRATLVASAGWTRHADAMLGRPALAAVRRR